MRRDQHVISPAGLEGTRTPLSFDDWTTTKSGSQDTPPTALKPMQLDEKTLESIAPFLRQTKEVHSGGCDTRELPARQPDEQHPSNEQQSKCWLRRVIARTTSKVSLAWSGRTVEDCTCWMCDYRAFKERCQHADRFIADVDGDSRRRNAR
ncbi:hypothetical protein CERZMDRAFT_89570 [Cercospora zeae-maydis SCOH1-5]|uniref:Uncharacterized protein n=1 Tax=Cercospora zeae-maydis SCOH1-5 TaxID=717836 RepID=A0A6A6FW42_9PEZI|nr:hypothetical protein CERZMDRAFT_89570 [Cercospora zeae-maydis SCOH1-5]